MKIENIKPIPKYIEKLIKKKFLNSYAKYSSRPSFYSYFSKFKNRLIQYTVAVIFKRNQVYMKQVAIHTVGSENCFIKDIVFYQIAGHIVGWYYQGLSKTKKRFEDNEWGLATAKYFNLYPTPVNKEYILTLKQYKYSAITEYTEWNYLKYLEYYEKYPIAEMLVKLGLSSFATSKLILEKLTKDKAFRKWLYHNKEKINHRNYVQTILTAYKTNQDIDKTQKIYELDKAFTSRSANYEKLKNLIPKNKKQEMLNYIIEQDTTLSSYQDYLNACNELELDLSLDKNMFPHNFKHWHDIRIDEYNSKQAEIDKRKRKKLYDQFKNVADKYLSLERLLIKDDYICLIAKSPQQLIHEGQELQHCVGRMGYDQKFAREETLIFFIRNRLAPNTPFVTLEYSISSKKILQCYAYHNSRPAEDVMEFVNHVWLPYANRKIRKIS